MLDLILSSQIVLLAAHRMYTMLDVMRLPELDILPLTQKKVTP
jgi:hypothetical protein